jgi:putative transposase
MHPDKDCKIQKDAFGDFYLIVPVEYVPKRKPKEIKDVASIDPGIRKYATVYTQEDVTLYGHQWATKTVEITMRIEKLISKRSKAVNKQKYVLNCRLQRLRKRLYNLKKEMRHKIANQIVKSADLVLLPKLSTKDLVVRTKRRLTTKTVKNLLCACHGMFFNHVKFKCHELGKHFLEVTEHYTSKTCPCCGNLSKCGEVFKCRKCLFTHDRDAVGALNILLRAVRAPFGDKGS